MSTRGARATRSSGRSAGSTRPPTRGSSASTLGFESQSYFPPGTPENQAHKVPAPLSVQQPALSSNRRGGGPFVTADHPPGWLPHQSDYGVRRQGAHGSGVDEDSSQMFEFFLDRFSRPLSKNARRRSVDGVVHGDAGATATGRIDHSSASTTMASSLASSQRSRSSVALRESRRNNGQVLLSQLLGPPAADATVRPSHSLPTMPTEDGRGGGSGDGSDDDGAGEGAASDKTSPRSLRLKVLKIEQYQRRQDALMASLRRENHELRRQQGSKTKENEALENEVARLSQQMAVLTEAQVNKAAEIKAAVELATGIDRRGGLGKGKTDAEFARLRDLYATTDELKTNKQLNGGGAGYDPWGEGHISTFEARDSMAEVLGSVKDFLATVESEQFVSRRMRDEAYHFAHSLDLHKLKEHVPTYETQRPDGSWAPVDVLTNKKLMAARENGERNVAVDVVKGIEESEEVAQRKWASQVDLKLNSLTRGHSRQLRTRERSQIERAAGVLSTISGVRLVLSNLSTPALHDEKHDDVESLLQQLFAPVVSRLATGCAPSLGMLFQFVITGWSEDATAPSKYVGLDLSVPPGKVAFDEQLKKPADTFQVTLQELQLLLEQLMSRTGEEESAADLVTAAAKAAPGGGAKGKKGKKAGKKKKGTDIARDAGGPVIWEDQLESGEWKALPNSVCRKLDALRNAIQQARSHPKRQARPVKIKLNQFDEIRRLADLLIGPGRSDARA